MKLNIITLSVLLNAACFATPVLMPTAEVLNKRLDEIGMRHFAQKTTIVEDLADQNKDALGVAVAVESALDDYSEKVKNPMLTNTVGMQKSLIIKTLLQDYPEALKELVELGVCEE
jgi:hypothetical protein